MLRDASQRGSAVDASALASCCDAPQHEGERGRRYVGQRDPLVILAKRSHVAVRKEEPTCGWWETVTAAIHCFRPVIYNELRNSNVSSVSTGKSAHDDTITSRSRQDLFLRSRISANTFHAGLPASPTDFATSGTSA